MAERTLKEEGALTKMRGLIFGFSITRAIAVAAELGIADRLADGPRTAAELVRECGVLEHPLYRMLRALAGEDVFAEDKDGSLEVISSRMFLPAPTRFSFRLCCTIGAMNNA